MIASLFYDPNLIIVIGDPGVGKTTLLNGMADYGGAAGDDLFEGVTSWEDVQVKRGPKMPSGKYLQVVDTPGLGGPKGKLTVWLANLMDILKKQAKHTAGLVLIVDGCLPRLQMSSHIMTQIVPALLNPGGNPWDRLCLVVSKCNMPNSIYQKKGAAEVRRLLTQGLQKGNVPRLETFNAERDIIFCGLNGQAPAYGALHDRLASMVVDTKVPDVRTGKPAIEVVKKALAGAVGDLVDGEPVATVATNMVEDAMKDSAKACDCCTIA